MFSYKAKIAEYLRSYVKYEFGFAGYYASYDGETQRHIKTKINEHLFTDKMSYVFHNLAGNDSRECKCDESCFKVIDTASSGSRL